MGVVVEEKADAAEGGTAVGVWPAKPDFDFEEGGERVGFDAGDFEGEDRGEAVVGLGG